MFDGAAVRWSVLALVSVWFTLIVPAHERGAIRIDGASAGSCCASERPATLAASSCCTAVDAADSSAPDDAPADPVRCCAICKVVAKMGSAGPAAVFVMSSQPLAEPVVETPASVPVAVGFDAHLARGPPART